MVVIIKIVYTYPGWYESHTYCNGLPEVPKGLWCSTRSSTKGQENMVLTDGSEYFKISWSSAPLMEFWIRHCWCQYCIYTKLTHWKNCNKICTQVDYTSEVSTLDEGQIVSVQWKNKLNSAKTDILESSIV